MTAYPDSLPKPPATERLPEEERLHNVTVTDAYRWLEDKDSPATRAWIHRQIAYTEGLLRRLPGTVELKQRLARLIDIEQTTIPTVRGSRHFYLHRPAGVEQHRLCLRAGPAGAPRTLVDPNPWSADHMTSVSIVDVSRDGEMLVYGIREGGEDEYTPVLFEVSGGTELGRLPKRRYLSLELHPDKKRCFYGLMTDNGPRVYTQIIGQGEPREIFGSDYGAGHWISAYLSDDGKHLLYLVQKGWASSWLFLADPERPEAPPRLLTGGAEGLFEPELAGGRVFVKTNWQAPKWRVLAFSWDQPDVNQWREVVPESEWLIESIRAAAGRLFVATLVNAAFRLAVVHPDTGSSREIPLPALGSIEEMGGEWDGSHVFFEFSSFAIPKSVYRLRPGAGARPARLRLWSSAARPVNPAGFEIRQVWYPSKDGTRIPMFLLSRKGLRQDGDTPALLYGYGGFNVALTPVFSSAYVTFVERGGLVAVANLRGGNEFGEEWHRAGMLDKKQNVFDDFLSAAEYLIRQKYTSPTRLAISGGSNGGLLVGAALTQRPELFRAVICSVPLLDMLRYHKFLLGSLWAPEYGSAEDPEQFRYLYAYSPYHRVKEGEKYPAVLFLTGDSDTRVDPLHARKMTALLQHASTSGLPVLLHYDLQAGHTASLPVSKRVSDTADTLQFLFWQLGMIAPPPE